MSGNFFLLNKQHGISSFKCILPLKKEFKKVGHSGTLDPYATGLLVVAVDRATKFIQYLPDTKEYFFSIQFGLKTDTDDLDGRVIEKNMDIPKLDDLINIIPNFIGLIRQTPSNFSAIKVNGQRAYKLARSSVCFSIPSRIVKIDTFELLSFNGNIASFRVVCHKGTYIRSLASQICQSIGVIGCVVELHRNFSNGFSLNDETKIGLECFLRFYKSIVLDQDLINKIKNGLKIRQDFNDGFYCLLDKKCSFYGLVNVSNNYVSRLCLVG